MSEQLIDIGSLVWTPLETAVNEAFELRRDVFRIGRRTSGFLDSQEHRDVLLVTPRWFSHE
jgi:hypothetical protein